MGELLFCCWNNKCQQKPVSCNYSLAVMQTISVLFRFVFENKQQEFSVSCRNDKNSNFTLFCSDPNRNQFVFKEWMLGTASKVPFASCCRFLKPHIDPMDYT